MTVGMYICHICGERFGPKGIDDPLYEESHNGVMVIQRLTDIWGISSNTILCPKCAKKVDELIERYSETFDKARE